ncbi:MAG: hypothetical protein EOO01_04520, partial [Chitinophagaceae bacterium]
MKILTYHKVENVENFERQLKLIRRRRYNVLSLDEFRQKYFSRSLKPNDLLITFDDGDYSVYRNAMPLLKKYNFPSVLFVITGLIGTDAPFWWNEIVHYTKSREQVRYSKKIDNKSRLLLIEQLRAAKDIEPLRQKQLTVEELREMELNGMAIANHTVTHPMLDKVIDSELISELEESAEFLRKHGFKNYDVIAYPNGNIAGEVIPYLEKFGFKMGMMFDHKTAINYNT